LIDIAGFFKVALSDEWRNRCDRNARYISSARIGRAAAVRVALVFAIVTGDGVNDYNGKIAISYLFA